MQYHILMRILFQTYCLAFQSPGGGERVILELQSALTRLGHRVDLYSPWNHKPGEYDILHYFSVLENNSWACLAKNFPNKPLFVTPTMFIRRGLSSWMQYKKEKFLSFFTKEEGQNLYKNMQLPVKFLPSTTYEKKNLMDYFEIPESKICVLPNGVSREFFDAKPDLFRAYSKIQFPYILHVGRFHPVKQQELIIRALMNEKISCVFIGSQDSGNPEYFQYCKTLSEKSLSKNFHFITDIVNNDSILASAYSGASLFVFPSLFETFGLAPLEAAIAGCPLLLSDGLVDKTIFSGAAEFVSDYSITAWREAILRKMSNLESNSIDLRKEKMEKFNWNAIALSLEAQYKKYI